MMIRQPAVAGSFYPANPAGLIEQVAGFLPENAAMHPVKGLIVPHAGYVYSGSVAGKTIAEAQIPEQVILIGPNHQGTGPAIAVSGADAWQTPLGQVAVAGDLREALVSHIPELSVDDRAHAHEHSLEVMLPFLQSRQTQLRIVPIVLGALSLEDCLQLGHALAVVLRECKDEVLLLASSDMNHFSNAEVTEQLDSLAIRAMTDYDPQGLYRVVRENRISMCGVLPAVTVLQAARELGADRCRLVAYSHSGKVNGDDSRVVGYAGLTIE